MADPIFSQFQPFCGLVPPGFVPEWNGLLVETRLFDPELAVPPRFSYFRGSLPEFGGEGYFDLIAVYRAAARANAVFTMAELGAGYGYWMTQAAAAARQKGMAFRLIGVEAEPGHYSMLLRHLCNNGIDPAGHMILEAAVAPQDGEVYFTVGCPLEWWGQSIVPSADFQIVQGEPKLVRAVSLTTLLAPHDFIDLVHMDVQGVEYDVLSAAFDLVQTRVGAVVVGTHGRDIEDHLRQLFVESWDCLYDYSLGGTYDTPYGRATFGDGLQIWENRRFLRRRRFGLPFRLRRRRRQ